MQQDDTQGYYLAIVLFTVVIPIIAGIMMYMAQQMPT